MPFWLFFLHSSGVLAVSVEVAASWTQAPPLEGADFQNAQFRRNPGRRPHTFKDAIPTSRNITKTDLAKYLMAWGGQPDVVSLGSQKCFNRFMSSMTVEEGQTFPPTPDVAVFKAMVAKAIMFKKIQSLVRPMFQAFQANVAAYTVALLSRNHGDRFDLARV